MEPLASYMFPGPERDRLVELIVAGHKTATVSRVAEYEGQPLPQVGDREVVVDSLGQPVCVTVNVAVERLPWADITWRHAVAEGEGHRDLAEYVAAHEAFWSSYNEWPAGHSVADAVGEVVWVNFRVAEDLRGRYPLGSRRPIVQAPMAGGPATPELVAAVVDAGGLGMLAGGYQGADELRAQIEAVEAVAEGAYGINLFVPASVAQSPGQAGEGSRECEAPGGAKPSGVKPGSGMLDGRHIPVDAAVRAAAVRNYAEVLAAAGLATTHTCGVPDAVAADAWEADTVEASVRDSGAPDILDGLLSESDLVADYAAKLEVALASFAWCVSFTFGIPQAADIARVKAAGKKVVLQATSPAGIAAAVNAGADILVVQGAGAGGHRASNAHWEEDSAEYELEELITTAMAAVQQSSQAAPIPVVAAGGIARAEDVSRVRAWGADAVQIGTALLRAAEAGTSPLHRQALREWSDRQLVLTRAFSGRMARGITNRFAEEFSSIAPAAYPEVHYLTAPIKRAGDPEFMSLWAGRGVNLGIDAPAADIIDSLLG